MRDTCAGRPGAVPIPSLCGTFTWSGGALGSWFTPWVPMPMLDWAWLSFRRSRDGRRRPADASCGAELLDASPVSKPASVADCRVCAGPVGSATETGFRLGLVWHSVAPPPPLLLRLDRNARADLMRGKCDFGSAFSGTSAHASLIVLSSLLLTRRSMLRVSTRKEQQPAWPLPACMVLL